MSAKRARWLSAVVLVPLLGCGGPEPEPQPEPPQARVCGEAEYAAAVRDSSEATAEEVNSGLWAITRSNPKLQWNAEGTAVRMVAWTTFGGYVQGDNVLTREVWVTAVPQLKEFCQAVADEKRVARINQFLGLPPATERDNSRRFAELWVRPQDMFRPCADPEIDDTVCGLQFPTSVAAEHRSWFTSNYSSSFGFWQQTRYPWTGLGYTYDWCGDTEVGASEFVIRPGSTVQLIGYVERQAYCVQ